MTTTKMIFLSITHCLGQNSMKLDVEPKVSSVISDVRLVEFIVSNCCIVYRHHSVVYGRTVRYPLFGIIIRRLNCFVVHYPFSYCSLSLLFDSRLPPSPFQKEFEFWAASGIVAEVLQKVLRCYRLVQTTLSYGYCP